MYYFQLTKHTGEKTAYFARVYIARRWGYISYSRDCSSWVSASDHRVARSILYQTKSGLKYFTLNFKKQKANNWLF